MRDSAVVMRKNSRAVDREGGATAAHQGGRSRRARSCSYYSTWERSAHFISLTTTENASGAIKRCVLPTFLLHYSSVETKLSSVSREEDKELNRAFVFLYPPKWGLNGKCGASRAFLYAISLREAAEAGGWSHEPPADMEIPVQQHWFSC